METPIRRLCLLFPFGRCFCVCSAVFFLLLSGCVSRLPVQVFHMIEISLKCAWHVCKNEFKFTIAWMPLIQPAAVNPLSCRFYAAVGCVLLYCSSQLCFFVSMWLCLFACVWYAWYEEASPWCRSAVSFLRFLLFIFVHGQVFFVLLQMV